MLENLIVSSEKLDPSHAYINFNLERAALNQSVVNERFTAKSIEFEILPYFEDTSYET